MDAKKGLQKGTENAMIKIEKVSFYKIQSVWKITFRVIHQNYFENLRFYIFGYLSDN